MGRAEPAKGARGISRVVLCNPASPPSAGQSQSQSHSDRFPQGPVGFKIIGELLDACHHEFTKVAAICLLVAEFTGTKKCTLSVL